MLIFIREVGAINNFAYRNLNSVDTLMASIALRGLRDLALIEPKNKGSATYYVPGLIMKTHQFESKTRQFEGKTHQLDEDEDSADFSILPVDLKEKLQNLSKKAPKLEVREIIQTLCKLDEMSAVKIAAYLRRKDKKQLVREFLSPMVDDDLLEYKFPQMPEHPQQKYRTKTRK